MFVKADSERVYAITTPLHGLTLNGEVAWFRAEGWGGSTSVFRISSPDEKPEYVEINAGIFCHFSNYQIYLYQTVKKHRWRYLMQIVGPGNRKQLIFEDNGSYNKDMDIIFRKATDKNFPSDAYDPRTPTPEQLQSAIHEFMK